MASIVRALKIREVSMCDAGANAPAKILLTKRAPKDVAPAAADQSLSRPTPPQEDVMDLSKVAPEVRAHVEKLEARIAELEKASAPPPKPEDILKSMPPEVRDRIEKAERENTETKARLEKLEDERLTDAFQKRAETLPQISKDRASLGTLLKRASLKLDKADFDALEMLLKAANEQIQKGSLFSETGSSGATASAEGDTAIAQATAKADELVKAGKVKTKEEGIAKAFRDDKKLYEQHRREQKGAH